MGLLDECVRTPKPRTYYGRQSFPHATSRSEKIRWIRHKIHKQNAYVLCIVDTIIVQKVKKLKSFQYIQGLYEYFKFRLI